MALESATNREPLLQSSSIAPTGSPGVEITDKQGSCVPSGLLMRLFVSVVLVLMIGAARGSRVNAASIQKNRTPAQAEKQTADDSFEILPDRVLQHVMRGDELARLRHYDQAVEEYRAAIKEAGKPVFTVYLNLGTLFFNKDDYAHAIEAYRQALAIRPNSWQAHYNLAEALFASADYPGAEKEYRRVLEIPSSQMAVRARHFLGLALYNQGRIDEAMVEYRGAIEQAEGDYAEAHYNLGIALLERAKPEMAEREFKLALEQEKKPWPEAQYNFAKSLERQKRYAEAANAYEEYLKLAPDSSDAQKMRVYIEYLRKKK